MNNDETNVEIVVADKAPVVPVKHTNLKLEKDTETDYDLVRKNLKTVIETGTEALTDMLDIAQQLEHPRAYEVVGQLLKTVVDSNNQLIELQKSMKDLTAEEGVGSSKVRDINIAFIGSTHDLQRLISGKTDIKDVPVIDPRTLDIEELDG